MKTLEKTVRIHLLNYSETEANERELIRLALAVRPHAQAPYSHYWVGCGLQTFGDFFYDGCNVENVNWTATTHAEQLAICDAIKKTVAGPMSIKAMAVVGAPEGEKIPWPPPSVFPPNYTPIASVGDVNPSCGHCLQIEAENAFGTDGEYNPGLILIGYNGYEIFKTTLGDAYPMPFIPQYLGVNLTKDPRYKKE